MKQEMLYSGNLHGVTGELSEAPNVKQIEWKIPFSKMSRKKMHYYKSGSFTFAHIDWRLCFFPCGNRHARNFHTSLFLVQESPGFLGNLSYLVGVKAKDGTVKCWPGGIRNARTFHFLLHGENNFCNEEEMFDLEKIALADVVTIVCIMACSDLKDEASTVKEHVGLKALSEDLEAAFVNGRASDLTLTVKEKKYKVHKSLLSARSTALAAMLEENKTEIDIPDCDEESFGYLLKYLYSGKCVNMSVECALQVYFTAQKFEAEELKSFCDRCMANNLTVENFTDVVIHAEKGGEEELFFAAQKFFNSNWRKIILTEKWVALLKDNHVLANKYIKRMAWNELVYPKKL